MKIKAPKSQTLLSMPDPLAPDHEKKSNTYGLQIAIGIQHEWFNGGMITKSTSFIERNEFVKNMRLFNRGEQDVEQYKTHLSRQEGDLDYLNLDWTPINVQGKFTNIVRNGISDDYYRIDIRSMDKFTLLERNKKIIQHKANRMSKPMLEKTKALLGIDLMPEGFIPEDDEELNLYMEIKDRPKHEISEEILIDYVKKTNNWDQIKKASDEDNVVAGLQVGRVYTDPNDGIKLEYVDPENFGHSFVERNDFSDAYYFFYVDTITISDIKRESGYGDDVLRKIAKSYGNSNSGTVQFDYERCNIDDVLDYQINVMRFTYKTSKEIVAKKYYDKKNNVRKVAFRNSEFEVPEGSERSRMSKKLDTWYEGSYIVGSNKYVYNYMECENVSKDQMNKAVPPFVAQATDIYKNRLRSFLSDIVPHCNQMQYQHLKMQHLIAELTPDLKAVDLDQLADLNTGVKGENKGKNWQTALSMMGVKGVVFTKRVNMGDDGIKDGAAVTPMNSQQGSALSILLNTWAHYYNLVRETTGINPARDGSLPADALVGVNQMMQLASNTATKHIVDASLEFDKRICETISSRIKSIFNFPEGKQIQKLYEQAVGKHHIESIESLKNRSIHEFGFVAEMIPAKQEMDELKQDLSIALQEGTVDVSEKSEIIRIARTNIKQANEYMKFIRSRKIKEKTKQDEYNQKIQQETNIASAKAKIEGEMQKYQMQSEIDLQKEAKLSTLRLKERQAMIEIEGPLKDKEFKQDLYLEKIKNLQTINITKYKEDEKRSREKESDTRQSKLIDQRQKDKNPLDFTNEFDIESLFR